MKQLLEPDLFVQDLSQERYNYYLSHNRLGVDCEMMGLNPHRDRLCLVQICDHRNVVSFVQVQLEQQKAPFLQSLFENHKIQKIFHYARMDTLFLKYRLNICVKNIFCTKIASKLIRTYTDKHSLKTLIREFYNEYIDKKNQTSDWGKKDLTREQLNYASNDVYYLLQLEKKLTEMLVREKRYELAQKCFQFIPIFNEMDWLQLEGVMEH